MNKSSFLNLSLQERCSSPLTTFVALNWIHPNISKSLCWGPQTWTWYSGWGNESKTEGVNHLLHPTGPFGATKLNLAFWACSMHCWFIYSFSSTRSPSLQGSTGVAPTQAQHLALVLVESL